MDIPVATEASLMEIFSEIREAFPMMQFYMGYRDTNLCFSSDKVVSRMNAQEII